MPVTHRVSPRKRQREPLEWPREAPRNPGPSGPGGCQGGMWLTVAEWQQLAVSATVWTLG
jgi:hypothetical protein